MSEKAIGVKKEKKDGYNINKWSRITDPVRNLVGSTSLAKGDGKGVGPSTERGCSDPL